MTRIVDWIKATPEDHKKTLNEASKIILNGGLVAFPTETVYGIGAHALMPKAIAGIYEAKGRPSDNPLIVHISSKKALEDYGTVAYPYVYALIERFWPGPLTLVLKKKSIVPDSVTGGLNTVAMRMPSHPIALALIEACGVPLAAPSANLSGRPSPTRGYHVIEDLSGRVEMIIDGGPCNIGLESTVLDVTQATPIILRPGSITATMIEDLVGSVRMDPYLVQDSQVPKSPGMKYKHYAPKGHMVVYSAKNDQTTEADVIAQMNQDAAYYKRQGKRVGIISSTQALDRYVCGIIMDIGSMYNHDQIAANLFKVLRKMDDLDVAIILTQSFIEVDIGVATMNRLLKAAGNRLIQV